MSNELIFFIDIIVYLSAVIAMFRIFGKNGLYVFAVFGTLLGNLSVCRCIDLFGLSATAGNVIYASTFLVTDILSERYGKKAANRSVAYSFSAMILWMIGTQLLLLLTPNAEDVLGTSLKTIFSLTPRITIGSVIAYACSQTLDVFLYHFIWKKTGGTSKRLWIRNNLATLISQAVDTVIFTCIAFWGMYTTDIFISILLTTYVFKAIVALCDTPFLYLARKIKPGGGEKETNNLKETEN